MRNQDLFDQIFVSISKSPKLEEDIALIRDCKLEKLHWTRQDADLSAAEHGRRFFRWVGSFQPEGHVFILCHDDILLRDGLLKLKELDLKEDEAAFGPFHFFFQEGSRREMTVHEFHRDDGKPVDKDMFIFLQDQQQFTYNVSGLVLPAKLYWEYPQPFHMLRYGCFAECSCMVHPMIRRIWQTEIPSVKIRWHAASEGALMNSNDMQHDSMAYHLMAAAAARDPELKKFQTVSVLYLIRMNLFRGIAYFLKLQFTLTKLKFYHAECWNIYGYMVRIVFTKLINLLKRILHAGVK